MRGSIQGTWTIMPKTTISEATGFQGARSGKFRATKVSG